MGLHDGSLLPELERGDETKGSKGGVVERNIMERKQKEGREGIYSLVTVEYTLPPS